jgi:hypothetical protein
MSRDRYLLLIRLLHFNDNETQIPGDRLYKLKPIVDHLRNVFSEVFTPFQNICIDENLMLFKGRLHFLQYIPSKRHRFGIKVFVLSDCETGYIQDFIMYTGANTDLVPEREFGISGAVVQTLMQKYLKKGHNLWLDNWYSSRVLYNWLHENGTRSDMMISCLECVRKSMKWYRKFFFLLLDITLLNSHAVYNVKTGKNITLADFQLTLIREILQHCHTPRPTTKSGRPSSGDQPLRLTERHFPSPVPPT